MALNQDNRDRGYKAMFFDLHIIKEKLSREKTCNLSDFI